MKTITQKEEQHAAACCSEPKNRYICISEESEGACTDTLFETLPANLYKKRWLIELFFKWLKQHLKIKKFWGTTENAVRIQISVAIITYCLVAIVQHDMKLKRSTYEVLQILSISLIDKNHLRDLFDKTNFNDVKDLNNPIIPGLFD